MKCSLLFPRYLGKTTPNLQKIASPIIVGVRHCEIDLANSNCRGNAFGRSREQFEILARLPVPYLKKWRPLLDGRIDSTGSPGRITAVGSINEASCDSNPELLDVTTTQ
jgi:hypothetical protein